jgi:hypothetical protein
LKIQDKNNHIVSFSRLKETKKSREGFRIAIACPRMLVFNCITFMRMPIFSMASINAYNSNISLESFINNLITKAKAFDNNQYPWH